MGRSALQPFELQVLLAILRVGGEAYSVPLVLELEKRSARDVSQAAVFIALSRLEKKGLLTSRFDTGSQSETGRVRRYFKLTRPALAALREARRAQLVLWEGLDRVLDKA